jgi:2'-5' RNA ligase
MIDRWQQRTEPAAGHSTLYWHILLGDQPQVVDLAQHAQQRLAGFSGLHMTPLKWLHITALVAGPADDISHEDFEEMAAAATQTLSGVQPITVTLGEIWYHPEAIMLGVQPASALEPLHAAARAATRQVTRADVPTASPPGWIPHVTVSYSMAVQPAAPIIDALGRQLPGCEARIKTLSLVIQRGAERRWDWHPVAAIHLGAPPLYTEDGKRSK